MRWASTAATSPNCRALTAQAFITTDLNDNPLTAFHPGALGQSHLNAVPDDAGIGLGIIAPDGRDGMQQHAHQFDEQGIPFIFDLGQAMPLFNGEELLWFIDRAGYVTLNDYEARVVVDRTRESLQELARRVKALVVTQGAQGSISTLTALCCIYRSPTRAVSSIRSAAATPTVAACCTVSRIVWTGNHRPYRGGHGIDQDRSQRRAELPSRPCLDRRAVFAGVRLPALVNRAFRARCAPAPSERCRRQSEGPSAKDRSRQWWAGCA